MDEKLNLVTGVTSIDPLNTLQEEHSFPDWSANSFIMVVCEKIVSSSARIFYPKQD